MIQLMLQICLFTVISLSASLRVPRERMIHYLVHSLPLVLSTELKSDKISLLTSDSDGSDGM